MKGKVIRDPIHGDIQLSELEIELVDTPQMQRLRNIKQNGLCFLVYPAMNSTRFEHSLGVMYLAGNVSNALDFDDEKERLLRVSGLLHDVGHFPFSHTSDELLSKIGYGHEENSCEIIKGTEIGDILNSYGIHPGEICDIVLGKKDLGKIISSSIDIDKMDYLTRDSYHAGVAYGIIDLDRVIGGMKMINEELIIEKGSLEAVESLLIGRNMMFQTVYRHHTKRIVEAMFRSALDSLLGNELSYPEFTKMDDINLISALRSSSGYVGDIMKRIDERMLFKRVFEQGVSPIAEQFRLELELHAKEIQVRIAEDAGVERGYLLLDMPESKFQEFNILIEDDGLHRIDEISELAKALKKSEEERLTLCVYTPKEHIDKIKGFDFDKHIQYTQTMLKKFYA
ncbi:MAG: hypothetical protein A7316_07545 [Candidatus Altiarchaeales archaeon WOR_SM1_86-2]|nr:MAG: hypothetical protein A7316_07545 [Candidatus Altiarchaeales archaeon WOR_SM1_86-2]